MSSRARIGLGVAALAVAVIAAVVTVMMRMAPSADLVLARDRSTARGLYRVSIAPEAATFDRATLHSWIARVRTADDVPVEGATISIDGGMPQHGHGLPTAPAVTASLGDGRYRIEGVRFNMGGWWEFKLAIQAAAGQDDVTFNLDL